jgi:hypothetical protein
MEKLKPLNVAAVIVVGILICVLNASAQCVDGVDCGDGQSAEMVGPEASAVETAVDVGDVPVEFVW